jgi:hypothetical protein
MREVKYSAGDVKKFLSYYPTRVNARDFLGYYFMDS